MARAGKVNIKQVLQICVVVRDLQKSMELYWDVFGIGPWRILTFKPPAMTNTKIRGKPVQYSMKLGLARIGNIQWELIQPLTGPSIYKEFLDQKGEVRRGKTQARRGNAMMFDVRRDVFVLGIGAR